MKQLLLVLAASIVLMGSNEAQTVRPESDGELKILTWNIYMLPFVIFKKSGKKERSRAIGKTLAERDYDMLLFQEAFKKNVRRVLRKELGDEYPYHYGPYNQRRLSFHTNSGLYVFSRKPLLYQKSIQFEACSGHSCLARKGAVLFEGEFQGRIFQVATTHTNGGSKVNNSQFHAIYDRLLEPYYEEGVPQIIAGDMNCQKDNEPEYREMLSLLHAEDAPTSGYPYSNWEQTNIIDYILIRPNESDIKIQKKEILAIGGQTNTSVARPARESIGLSDHYALEIILTW
jgi:endonuclease/exonuclease/phosphatase family metal-dependent hydrolase